MQDVIDTLNGDFKKAMRIVRTESNRAINRGFQDVSEDAAELLLGSDYVEVKEWCSMEDELVRSTHSHLNGKIIHVLDSFESAGAKAKCPGTFGVAAEDINCRCFLDYSFMDRDEFIAQGGVIPDEVLEKEVDIFGESGIIKAITIDDYELRSYGKKIQKEVQETLFSEIKQCEKDGTLIFSDVIFEHLGGSEQGTYALQTEMLPNGLLKLNVNLDVFSGCTLDEINQRFLNSKSILANDLHEAMIHERGHAKTMRGHTPSDIRKIHNELSKIHLKGVSKCAYDDGAECIAETEILISRGEKIPDDVMKLYQKYTTR